MNSKSTSQAMETEKIPRLLAQLAIPAVVAQIINLLYNIVDRIYIGHISGVGAAALTGVGLFTPILMLINAFAMLAGSGGAPRAAISMGKKDNKTAEKNSWKLFCTSHPYGCRTYCSLLYICATAVDTFWCQREDTAVWSNIRKNLYPWKYLCLNRNGNESIYYNTGICQDQYDDYCDRSCDQYHS